MCSKLANARQRHGIGLGKRRRIFAERIKKSLGNEKHLPNTQRIKTHMAVDDLSCARIGDGVANGPSSGRAWYPFDDVVTNVHGIHAFREQLDLEGVLVTGGGKCLVPPANSFKHGGADRLRNRTVHVVDDRLYRFADRSGRVLLCQPMPRNVALYYGFVHRSGKVHITDAELSGTWIVGAAVESRRRRLNKRNMLANRDGMRFRRDLLDEIAGIFTHKSKC